MRFSVYAVMAAAATAIKIDSVTANDSLAHEAAEDLYADFAAQFDNGTISDEEFGILSQCLDGELDFNEFAQNEHDHFAQSDSNNKSEAEPKSEGFMAAIGKMQQSALGQLHTFGEKAVKSVTSGAQACADAVGNCAKGALNWLPGASMATQKPADKKPAEPKKSEDKKPDPKKKK